MAKTKIMFLFCLALVLSLVNAGDPFDVDPKFKSEVSEPKFKFAISCQFCLKALKMIRTQLGSDLGKTAVTSAIMAACKPIPKLPCPEKFIKPIVGFAIDIFNKQILKDPICGQSLLGCKEKPGTFKSGGDGIKCTVINTIHRELNPELIVFVANKLCPKVKFGMRGLCKRIANNHKDKLARVARTVAEKIALAINCPPISAFKAISGGPSRMSGAFDDHLIDEMARFINELDRSGGK